MPTDTDISDYGPDMIQHNEFVNMKEDAWANSHCDVMLQSHWCLISSWFRQNFLLGDLRTTTAALKNLEPFWRLAIS